MIYWAPLNLNVIILIGFFKKNELMSRFHAGFEISTPLVQIFRLISIIKKVLRKQIHVFPWFAVVVFRKNMTYQIDLCLSGNKRLRFVDIIVESFLFGVDVSQKLQLSGSLLRWRLAGGATSMSFRTFGTGTFYS